MTNKKRIIIFIISIVVLIVVVLTLLFIKYHCDQKKRDLKSTYSTPTIYYNDSTYVIHPANILLDQTPNGYEKVKDNQINANIPFEKVYCGESGDSLYVYTNLFLNDKKKYKYRLFVKNEMLHDMIFYNGNLYCNKHGVSNYVSQVSVKLEEVGQIQSVFYDVIPNKEFQSNILNSEKCKVFIEQNNSSLLYVLISENNYIKLEKEKGK